MTRNRRSAKDAGTKFERLNADYQARHIDDRIDRRPKNGTKDRGDIGGLRHMGLRVVQQCKDYASGWRLAEWLRSVDEQRRNDDAGVGLLILKRRGHIRAGDQLVVMTQRDLVALLTGERPDD